MAFNLKKSQRQAPVADQFSQMADQVPDGYNPIAVNFLWNNVYKNDPNIQSIPDMISALGDAEHIQMEYETMSNPEVIENLQQPAQIMENLNIQLEQVIGSNKGNNKMKKPFNFKKAQFENPAGPPVAMQGFSDTLNDSPEMMGDQLGMQQDIGQSGKKFRDGSDVSQWLQTETDLSGALQFTTENDISGNADLVKEMIEQFYDLIGDPSSNPRDLEIIAGQIFDYFPESVKEGGEIRAVEKEFKVVNDTIQKIAQKTVGKNNKKPFNIKTAQHKSLDNAILYGPGETRIDPFLRQPVSDWHIVERNKGFGLVVDDVWNIDYETIWRENVMDKYSRPYRNKEGEWVGGYIQKRFEVDKNIPDTNNLQLKPGEIRRPILPEYGNTESRLQAARSKGDIEGAIDTSKPFNWKEASSKKKS